jgi:YegS/Rv2252/BmrU family lipid kinase
VICVVYNPVAGPALVNRIDRVRAALASRSIEASFRETAAPGHAVEIAREAASKGCEAVLAVGGDGTVNEVANGLAGSATALAVVPHGTGNVYAAEAGLPADPEGCVELLRSGRRVSIPLAKAAGRYFLFTASAGFDAEVVERMTSRHKNLLGISAYYLAGALHLLRRQPALWLDLPGRERMEAQAVIVSRGRFYGAGVVLVPQADLLSERMYAVILKAKGRLAIVRFALDVLRGKHLSSPRVEVRELSHLMARSTIPSAAQADGEYLCPLPVRFEMTETRLLAIVPPSPGPAATA